MPKPQNIEQNRLPEKNNQFIIFKTEDDKISIDVRKEVKYYNLDMIISLGYRINSKIATKFRQWATLRLFLFYLCPSKY